MPRPTVIERARLYLAKCPPSISGSGGHNAAFSAACALVKGFDLTVGEARGLLAEWNRGCKPPWSERELEHKLQQAATVADERARGWLLSGDEEYDRAAESRSTPGQSGEYGRPPAPVFDLEKLQRFVKGWDEAVDLIWLANRSAQDPATVTPEMFLRMMYGPEEMVVLFTDQRSQGQAVWPHDAIVAQGPEGVWFLAQPVDGRFHPNPRVTPPKSSRRSEESVTAFRYLVIESDEAPLRLWLGALAQLPLRIAALYSSGGRSVHALVRLDCPTKSAWDEEKRALKPALVLLGADPGAMSAVRLTRLPGCLRGRSLQKLLYVQPSAPLRRLIDLPVVRDVEKDWTALAWGGVADSDPTGGAWIRAGLQYYAPVSNKCQAALAAFAPEKEGA